MNILKPITFKYYELFIFKISMISIGIFIGANWSNFFENYTIIALMIGIATAPYLLSIWFKQQK